MNIQLSSLFRRKQRTSAASQHYQNCLLVHDDLLIHLGSAQHTPLLKDPQQSRLSAEDIAKAAARLLAESQPAGDILLALAPEEFVTTEVHLPGVTADNLRSAVQLQLPALLPGSTPLLLAIHSDKHDDSGRHIGVWLPSARAEALYHAFAAEGLSLTGLLPRPLLALPQGEQTCWIHDEDQHELCYIAWSGHHVQQWLQVPRDEIEIEDFRAQLEHSVQHPEDQREVQRLSAIDWEVAGNPQSSAYHYCITPPSALLAQAQKRQQKKRRTMLISAGAVLGVIVLALSSLAGYHYYLEKRLQAKLESTRDVSHLREEIRDTEEYLSPIVSFPQQRVGVVLDKLNQLIPKDTWLVGFKIEDGIVELDGYGPNPAKLLELIANTEEFEAVAFNRSTETGRGPQGRDHFGIGFHLKGIDVHAYLKEHFPVED